ncbi:MAG: hypothetical protein KTR20_15145 [Cellvibrionaceae bacterium]|nr:hypothetical protein [Cellvibrionaceae bacterium]
MLRQFTLQPNEDKRLQIEGRYLIVTQATGPLELSLGGTTPITVDEKDRVHLRDTSPNDRALRIKNISGGVNAVEFHTSDLLIDKRTGVDVKNAIQIADDQQIGIDPQNNIVQSIVQNPVRIDASQNTITIADEQCIGIDPNKNTVTLAPAQTVGIDSLNNHVRVMRTHTVFQPLPTIEFISPDGNAEDEPISETIAANPQRQSLTLSASEENFNPIWLGNVEEQGTPLFPGEKFTVHSANAINLVALTGQVLYLSETVIVDDPL